MTEESLGRLAGLEAELDRLRRELDHTARLSTIGTMTAGIAHEINNVLTPALAYAQLAGRRPGDREFHLKALASCQSGIEAATRILGAVLGFSTGDDGAEATSAVDAVLTAALACLGRDLAREGIAFEQRVEPGTQAAIQPLALQQVLLNLLLNSTRALKGRGGTIVVSSRTTEAGDVVLRFVDDGPGIPPEIAERLFEPFVSLPATGAGHLEAEHDPRGGSGLGLAMCRRTIEGAGGSIGCSTTPGGGATFEIVLPVP